MPCILGQIKCTFWPCAVSAEFSGAVELALKYWFRLSGRYTDPMASQFSLFEPVSFSENRLDDTSVHEIRKSTKQIRAHLALLRALEGNHPENEKLRLSVKRLARMLCAQRDLFVINSALQTMAAERAEPGLALLAPKVREDLETLTFSEREVEQIQELLIEIADSAPALLHTDFDASAVDQFLQSGLATVSRFGPSLLAAENFDDLHNWRKQVKTLMYQYQLKPSSANRDLQVIEQLEQLGSSLGEVNDMHLLKHFVLGQQQLLSAAENRESYGRILNLVDDKLRQKLESSRAIFGRLSAL